MTIKKSITKQLSALVIAIAIPSLSLGQSWFDSIDPYLDTDVDAVVSIELNSFDAEAKRWQEAGIPLPFEITSQFDVLKKAGVESIQALVGSQIFGKDPRETVELCFVVQGKESTKIRKTIVPLIEGLGLKLSIAERPNHLIVALNDNALRWGETKNGSPNETLISVLKKWKTPTGAVVTLNEVLKHSLRAAIPADLVARLKFLESLENVQVFSESDGRYELTANFDNDDAAEIATMEARKIGLPLENQKKMVKMPIGMGEPFFKELLKRQREQASVMRDMNAMRQISLAFHNFSDAHGTLVPQSLSSEDGKPLLSWRVLILPYLGEQDLFQKFKLDEPWDSPNNKALIPKMPLAYAMNGQSSADGKTYFVAPITANSFMGRKGPPGKFSDITDGTSNTIWIVKVPQDKGVIWTQPDDLTIDPNASTSAWKNEDSILIGMIDGSVRRLPAAVSPKSFLELISINSGEVIDQNELDR